MRMMRKRRLAVAALVISTVPVDASVALFADSFTSSSAPFSGMALARDTGCSLGGLSLQYVFRGVTPELFALSLDMNLSSTNLRLDVSAMMALSSVGLDDMVGINSNAYFRERMCSQPARHLFPKACSFFDRAHLASLCPSLAPLIMAPTRQLFRPLTQDDPFVVRSLPGAVPELFGEAAPFELQIIEGSPCRPDGLHLSYVKFGSTLALQVDVSAHDISVFDAAGTLASAGIGDLAGQHSHARFLEKACTVQVRKVLPKACDFFSASHLGGICPDLEPLLLSTRRVRDMKYSLVDAISADDDPFMLRPSSGLDWQTARGSPCTPLGLSLRYYLAGAALALEVSVFLSSVEFRASPDFYAALELGGLGSLVGNHEMGAFRQVLCSADGLSFFPRACDFLAPAHLGLLCAPLQPLLKTAADMWLAGL